MANRRFAERLNDELDSIGMPPNIDERAKAFAKLTKLPKFKAQELLHGAYSPDELLLKLLAEELEVDSDYLIGRSDKKDSN